MFRHVAVFRFAPDSTAEQHQAIVDALRTLPSIIPELKDYRVGLDAGLAEGNFEMAVVADFDDEAGWRTYTADAEHQRMIAELIRPILADRSAVQHEV
jgi:hypothetical protein